MARERDVDVVILGGGPAGSTAGALLAGGIDRMIAMDWLPPLVDPVWDTSWLLDDGSGAGRLMADFLGYRARPTGVLLLSYIALWSFVFWRLAGMNRKPQAAARVATTVPYK